MSFIEVSKVFKSIGYVTWRSLWYKDSKLSLQTGLRPLNNDKDVLTLLFQNCKKQISKDKMACQEISTYS